MKTLKRSAFCRSRVVRKNCGRSFCQLVILSMYKNLYNKRLVDTIRSGLLIIIFSLSIIYYYNYQGADVNILQEVSKDAKLKAWFFQTLEVCDLTWRQSDALLQRQSSLQISAGEGAKTGVLSRETEGSKKWRGGAIGSQCSLLIARLSNE